MCRFSPRRTDSQLLDGLRGAVAAFARIPDDAADEARVGGGDAVVAVQVQLRQSRDVNPVGLFTDAGRDQAWVHSVDSLQDDRLPILQADHLSLLASSGLEVVARQLDLLALDQKLQMLASNGRSRASMASKSGLPSSTKWRLIAIEEVIIEFQGKGGNPECQQLDGQST